MKRRSILFAAMARLRTLFTAALPAASHAAMKSNATVGKASHVPTTDKLGSGASLGSFAGIYAGDETCSTYVEGFNMRAIAPYEMLLGGGMHPLTGFAPGMSFVPMVSECGFFT